mgnify:CR=1 FL=1
MSNLSKNQKLEIKLKKNFLILFISFLIGITIPTIPFITNIISNWKIQRLKTLENKNLIIKLKENCKSGNIKYRKLQSLGFEKFAIEEFNNCFKENLEKQNEIF